MSDSLSLDEASVIQESAQEAGGKASRYAAARPQDLAATERLARTRLPTLEYINERAQDHIAASIASFGAVEVRVRAKMPMTMAYADLMKRLPLPTCLNVVDVSGFRGPAMVVVSPTILDSLVDSLFGGSGLAPARAREGDFTETELRLAKRMLEGVLRSYAKEWDVLPSMAFRVKKQASNPQFVMISAPTDLVVTVAFEVFLAGSSDPAELLFCFPNSSIEPIRELLQAPVLGDASEVVTPWAERMGARLSSAPLDVRADLSTVSLTIEEIANLSVGDFIALDKNPVIDASVDGEVLFRCRYGVSSAKYAIEIVEIVDPAPDALAEKLDESGSE